MPPPLPKSIINDSQILIQLPNSNNNPYNVTSNYIDSPN